MGTYDLHISVRSLVEFIFREGDIDNRAGRLQSADAMVEGTRIHKLIQGSMGKSYRAEVPLAIREEGELYDLTIEGRADGIFVEEHTWIDEIKGTYRHLEHMESPVYVHKAQALCYAYIYAVQNSLSEIGVQLTYVHMEPPKGKSHRKEKPLEKRQFRELLSFEEVSGWYQELLAQYRKWADFQYEWREKRQESIRGLSFPYEYREGQRRLVAAVYHTIREKKTLFLQAPTGVGKTISTVFPAVKAVGEDLADRVFYLTAKTITGTVAEEAFELLRGHGYHGKIIRLTAKEKLCLCEEMECRPDRCPYARGHYDRVNDAVFALLQREDVFTREVIWEQARRHMVCPFEMSLDVASFSDDIICDYNYVFDPNVALKRFFQENPSERFLFLVDEAHNLVERSRGMYSAALVKEDFLSVKNILKEIHPGLCRRLDRCNRALLEYKRKCEGYRVLKDGIGNFYYYLYLLYGDLEEFLIRPQEFLGRKEVLDFYFELRNFMNIYNLMDERYVVYTQFMEDGRFRIRLFCVDPSANLQKCINKSRSTVFFSATLLPIHYYKSLLSEAKDDYAIYAQSTFDPAKRLLLFGRDVSTRYTRRTEEEFARIAEYILRTVRCRAGNYMVFFPSYRLMEQVFDSFLRLDVKLSCECTMQTAGMDEEEREHFLSLFEKPGEHPFVAFCVMGGIFGEGIDLKYDRLIGCIVVGTGLPQISDEREILKNYYDRHNHSGFDYAFRYPGMNKVLQAAGRVIRTTEDEGVILLLDERFLSPDYRTLFPREWEDRQVCSLTDVGDYVRAFWERRKGVKGVKIEDKNDSEE